VVVEPGTYKLSNCPSSAITSQVAMVSANIMMADASAAFSYYPGFTQSGTTYAIVATDRTIGCNAAGGNQVATLPLATGSGKEYVYQKVDSSGNTCSLAVQGSDLINGSGAGIALATQWQSVRVQDIGANTWWSPTASVAFSGISGTLGLTQNTGNGANSDVNLSAGVLGISFPTGTTGQRPGSPVDGEERRNSTMGCSERYVLASTQWRCNGGVYAISVDGATHATSSATKTNLKAIKIPASMLSANGRIRVDDAVELSQLIQQQNGRTQVQHDQRRYHGGLRCHGRCGHDNRRASVYGDHSEFERDQRANRVHRI